MYKALTGASKYALLKTFLMETGEDPEAVSEHDKSAVTRHSVEEETALKNILSLAQVMIDQAKKANLDSVLNDAWRAQHAGIETMRKNYPELFTKVRNAFTKRKEELLILQSKAEGAK